MISLVAPALTYPKESFTRHADRRVGVYRGLDTIGPEFMESDLLAAEVFDPRLELLGDFKGLHWRNGFSFSQTIEADESPLDIPDRAEAWDQLFSLALVIAGLCQRILGQTSVGAALSSQGDNTDFHSDISYQRRLSFVKPLFTDPGQTIRGTEWLEGVRPGETIGSLYLLGDDERCLEGHTLHTADPRALFVMKDGVDPEHFQDRTTPRADCLFHRASWQRGLTLLAS